MCHLLIVILLAFAIPSFGKDSLRISFIPVFQGKTISAGIPLQFQNHPLVFDVFRFYISNIQLHQKGKIIFREKNSFHLIDFSEKGKMKIHLGLSKNTLQADSISLQLGIDSATNISGVHGGDLDPTNGMYWAWQSGYINMKIEGRTHFENESDSTFQYHLGGYAAPFSALQHLQFAIPKNKILNISIDLFPFMEQLHGTRPARIMSPGNKAVQLSAFMATLFMQEP